MQQAQVDENGCVLVYDKQHIRDELGALGDQALEAWVKGLEALPLSSRAAL